MKIVYLRQSPDWKNMTEDTFFSQSFTHSQSYWKTVLETVWKFIKIWDKHCNITYFQYRQELKDIALNNIQSLNVELITKEEELKLTDNLILIPIDDDDWLSPNIFEVIEEYDADIILWNHTIINPEGKIQIYKNKKLHTNNFAITSSGIKKLRIIPQSKGLLEDFPLATSPFFPHYDLHRRIIKTEFENNQHRFENLLNDDFKITHIDQELSVTNKTLSSASELMKINENEFLQKMLNLPLQKINNRVWSKEISKLNSLNNQLKIKQLTFI